MGETLRTPTLRQCVRDHGEAAVRDQILATLAQADVALGGGSTLDSLAVLAGLLMADYGNRPIGGIIMAIRRGIRNPAVGHRLTYPILCSWMDAQDAAVERHNHDQHLRTK